MPSAASFSSSGEMVKPAPSLGPCSFSFATTVRESGEVIDTMEKQHPGIKDRLLDDKGVRRFVNIYVGDEDIRFLDGLATEVKAGDQISIIPAIAGG